MVKQRTDWPVFIVIYLFFQQTRSETTMTIRGCYNNMKVQHIGAFKRNLTAAEDLVCFFFFTAEKISNSCSQWCRCALRVWLVHLYTTAGLQVKLSTSDNASHKMSVTLLHRGLCFCGSNHHKTCFIWHVRDLNMIWFIHCSSCKMVIHVGDCSVCTFL